MTFPPLVEDLSSPLSPSVKGAEELSCVSGLDVAEYTLTVPVSPGCSLQKY
jgi:hypothetical protein